MDNYKRLRSAAYPPGITDCAPCPDNNRRPDCVGWAWFCRARLLTFRGGGHGETVPALRFRNYIYKLTGQ